MAKLPPLELPDRALRGDRKTSFSRRKVTSTWEGETTVHMDWTVMANFGTDITHELMCRFSASATHRASRAAVAEKLWELRRYVHDKAHRRAEGC